MLITELLTLDRIELNAHIHSKKRLFEHVSELVSNDVNQFSSDEIFHTLLSRERLGSTAVGHGVAIPHGRLKTVESAVGAFLRVEPPLAFDALDGEPVDLFFILLVPEEADESHLQWLSVLAHCFSNDTLRERLRTAKTKEIAYHTLQEALHAAIKWRQEQS